MEKVKEFPGNPTVFVSSTTIGIEVTTPEHMRNANRPLIQILKEICEEARVYANQIYPKYDYPNGMWFPCGNADIVLRWNTHRDIIQLFKKEADPPERAHSQWYRGWFGRLFKTNDGWWWIPKLDKDRTQSMKYYEAVCQFVRDKLIFANIKVDVRTYID